MHINFGKPGELFPHIFFELDEYERCYDNDLFHNKSYPFDQDFKNVMTTDGESQEYIPIKDRDAYIEVALGKVIVESVTASTFGKENFPKIVGFSAASLYSGLGVDESNTELQRFIKKVMKLTHTESTMLDVSRKALTMKSSIVLFKIVNGKPQFEVLNRKWCRNFKYNEEDPEQIDSFDEIKVEWDEEEDAYYWCKRSFDTDGEIEYAPILFEEGCDELPDFKVVKSYTVHGLGYLPAVKINNTDNESIFTGQIKNLSLYSYFCSFITVGLQRNTNPQPIFMGKRAPTGDLTKSDQGMWTLPEGKFTSYAANPMSYQSAQEWEKRMRELILRGCRVIEIPDDNYQSGDAIRLKMSPEENLVQVTRTNLGDKGLLSILEMAFKTIVEFNGKSIERNGESFLLDIDLGQTILIPNTTDFEVSLEWGEIFAPTSKSKNMDVQTAIMAMNSEAEEEPLFSRSSLRSATSHIFKVNDLGKEVTQIEKEKRQRLMNTGLDALMQAAIKAGDIEFLLKMLDKLSQGDEDFTDLAGEYGTVDDDINTKDINKQISEEEYENGDLSGSDAKDDQAGRMDG